jgi:hypothetical protein
MSTPDQTDLHERTPRRGLPSELRSGIGCPLSPLLFLVITEALTRLIVQDPQSKGIEINGVNHLIVQYADDSTLAGRIAEDWRRQQGHLSTIGVPQRPWPRTRRREKGSS